MNLQEAADHLGVHYQTAYRWMRSGVLNATKVASVYQIDADDVHRLAEQRRLPSAPPQRLQVRNWDVHLGNLLTALREGDELEARLIVDRLADGHVASIDICEHLLAPALSVIGGEWHEGSLTIAHECRATAIIGRIIGRLTAHPRGRPRGTVVVATPPGESHSMPAALAALVLRDDRWRVHHLGNELPFEETAAMARRLNADLVVISTTVTSPEAVIALEVQLRGTGARVLVGTPGRSLSELVRLARDSA